MGIITDNWELILKGLGNYLFLGLCVLMIIKIPFDKGINKKNDESLVSINKEYIYMFFVLFWFPMICRAIFKVFSQRGETKK